jgi:hypothetical protein
MSNALIRKSDLDEYIEVSEKAREANKRKEELRKAILQALDAGAKVPAAYSVIVDTQWRKSIPWQEEAQRWQAIARGYAEQLGVSDREFEKHFVEYPLTSVQVLKVARK